MENKNDLANTLYELMKEFTKCFNNIYPHLRCNVYYDNMYNHIVENSNYYHGGYHVTDKFAEYFKGCYSQFGSYRFTMNISKKNIKVVKNAILKIKKLKPERIEPGYGKIYIMNKDFTIGTRFRLKAGTKFEVLDIGYNWRYQTILKILDGEIATTCHSSFFDTKKMKLNNVSGNAEKFYTLKEFKKVFGVSLNKLKVSYDPFGGGHLPCEEFIECEKSSEESA